MRNARIRGQAGEVKILGILGLGGLLLGCGDSRSVPDAHTDAPADVAIDAALPLLGGVCLESDGDVGVVPVAAKTPMCIGMGQPDSAAPLFADVGTLGADYTALHALCGRMDPAPDTHDALSNAQLASDLHAYFVGLVAQPALQRALASLPADADMRASALEAVWFPNNGFEHVMCGEVAPNNTVAGLHLWSEYYQAEREGRADYLCTQQGATDPAIAATQFTWQPPGSSTGLTKPLGSFFVGASPACILALGYVATHDTAVLDAHGDVANLRAELYGQTRDWVLAMPGRTIVTLYPHAQ